MSCDENEFFKLATLRICGHLEIDQAMIDFLAYLRDFIPADRIICQIATSKITSKTQEILAYVVNDSVICKNLHIQASQEFSEIAEEMIQKNALSIHPSGVGLKVETTAINALVEKLRKLNPEIDLDFEFKEGTLEPVVVILKKAWDFHPMRNTVEQLELPNGPALMLALMVQGAMLGQMILMNSENKQYTKQHAHLLQLLNGPIAIATANSIRYREVKMLKELLADENLFLQEELRELTEGKIIGADFGLKQTMEMVSQVAMQESPVLLLGETGVGKEVIASTIHKMSGRKSGPFIKVNSGAIPENLVDSELFGHEKGAFTGAFSQKKGRFERAHGGTIFLDEIGELPLDAQVRLLRVLQDKEIERIGGTKAIPVDIRIIAATHRNLREMIDEGRFREDLYFRLNVFPIEIPPVRYRTVDIPSFVHHFIVRKAREMKLREIPTLASGVIDRLKQYRWPGNVRELENVIERALILYDGNPLTYEMILPSAAPVPKKVEDESVSEVISYNEVLQHHFSRVLEMTNGKIHGTGGAAELLGLNPSTLRKKLNKLGIAYSRKFSKTTDQ